MVTAALPSVQEAASGSGQRKRKRRDTHAALAGLVPLPLHAEGLWEALTEELNEVLLGHFPAPAMPEGSLGARLRDGADGRAASS